MATVLLGFQWATPDSFFYSLCNIGYTEFLCPYNRTAGYARIKIHVLSVNPAGVVRFWAEPSRIWFGKSHDSAPLKKGLLFFENTLLARVVKQVDTADLKSAASFIAGVPVRFRSRAPNSKPRRSINVRLFSFLPSKQQIPYCM